MIQEKKKEEINFWQGAEACCEGAIVAGCKFFAGYPISPSSEIEGCMARRLPQIGGTFLQMEDEIASIAACLGASWAGMKAMTATSGPGLSLMLENIGYAVMTETPCVIVDVQRVGPSTGQATRPAQGDMQQVRWGAHGDYEIIALTPSSVEEMYELTIDGFNLSEKYRVPVILLADELVAHLREGVKFKPPKEIIGRNKELGKAPFGPAIGGTGAASDDGVPPMPPLGSGAKLLVTGSTHDEWGMRRTTSPLAQEKLVSRLSKKILNHKDDIIKYEKFFEDGADTLIVSYGFSARSSLRAVKLMREDDVKTSFLKLKTIWPFPSELLAELGEQYSRIAVVEMNAGQIAREVERSVRRDVLKVSKATGEPITPAEIVERLK